MWEIIMPQEFQVLQCYNCETFQVHQVKKVTKWQCKLCGEKQSVKKVYGRGSGKDCRCHVQKLNSMRGKLQTTLSNIQTHSNENIVRQHEEHQESWEQHDQRSLQSSGSENNKWGIYVDNDNVNQLDTNDDDEGVDDVTDNMYTTDATVFQRGKKRKRVSSLNNQRLNRHDNESQPGKISKTWTECSEEPDGISKTTDQQYGINENLYNKTHLSQLYKNDSTTCTSKRKSNSLADTSSKSTSKWDSYVKPLNHSELVESDDEVADVSYHDAFMNKHNRLPTLTHHEDVLPCNSQPRHDLKPSDKAQIVNFVASDKNKDLVKVDSTSVKSKFVNRTDGTKSKWSSFLNSTEDKISSTFCENSGPENNKRSTCAINFSTGALSDEDFVL
ncbi:hypothetical protein ACF0H5_023099 [Mactra antiquata]